MGKYHVEQLERRNRELSILNTIAEALNREADLSRALNAVLGQVADLLELHTGWVYLLDDVKGKFYTAATQNLPPALADNPRRLGGTCYCLDTYLDGDLDGAANVNVVKCSRLENLGWDGWASVSRQYSTVCARQAVGRVERGQYGLARIIVG